jgi:putative sugar O-methyltransferase
MVRGAIPRRPVRLMDVSMFCPIGSLRQASDESLLAQVREDLATLQDGRLTSRSDGALIPLWSSRTSAALDRLVASDGDLDAGALRNFRREQILVDDLPRDIGRQVLPNDTARRVAQGLLIGWRRSTRNCLLQCLDILRTQGFDTLLRTYPCLPVGNPSIFKYRGYEYTFRWARQVYFLGLLNRILRSLLPADAVVLDIGSSYGIFSGLVKMEYPGTHHILVDLPEQLILARYFLGSWFSNARIAGVSELLPEPSITKDLVLEHDFLLVPTTLFPRIAANTVDLVTNFASMSEMTRDYFNLYLRSEVFLSSSFFYTINRIEAYPKSFRADISILDFPLMDEQKRLHFGVCPIFSVDFLFSPRHVFLSSHSDPPPYFEYIGRT